MYRSVFNCRQSARRQKKSRAGASLVEFALVLPVFILMLFICIEFARLNMIRNLAQDAAYYASRHCIVPGATEAEAIAEAQRILNSMGTRGATIVINDGQGLDENSASVKVQITVPLAANALLTSRFTNDIVLTSESVMRTERYDGYYDPSL